MPEIFDVSNDIDTATPHNDENDTIESTSIIETGNCIFLDAKSDSTPAPRSYLKVQRKSKSRKSTKSCETSASPTLNLITLKIPTSNAANPMSAS